MKILIVITHGNIGGATNFVVGLAKGLVERSIEISVGFGNGEYLQKQLEKENINYINFKWLKRSHNPLTNLFFIFELRNFLNKNKFDIVHFNSSNSLCGAVGAKLSKTKIKTVFTFHGLSVLDPNYPCSFIVKKIYGLVFKFFLFFIDESVFVCKANLKTADSLKLVRNSSVIYNGLDFKELFFLDKETAIINLEKQTNITLKDKYIIGSIGRLDASKNYEFLIAVIPELLKKNSNIILIIIGDGSQRKKYESMIKKLNIQDNIFLTGEVDNARQYLKVFDVFVLTSRYEGLSISLLEALRANIPVLATDVGGNAEIVGQNNVYQLNNKQEFLAKVFAVSIAQQADMQKFTVQKMIRDYLRVYT